MSIDIDNKLWLHRTRNKSKVQKMKSMESIAWDNSLYITFSFKDLIGWCILFAVKEESSTPSLHSYFHSFFYLFIRLSSSSCLPPFPWFFQIKKYNLSPNILHLPPSLHSFSLTTFLKTKEPLTQISPPPAKELLQQL